MVPFNQVAQVAVNVRGFVGVFDDRQPAKPHGQNFVYVDGASVPFEDFGDGGDCVFGWVDVFRFSVIQ